MPFAVRFLPVFGVAVGYAFRPEVVCAGEDAEDLDDVDDEVTGYHV